ncbi:MAG: histidinol-phosphatase HisJ family protein [Lachnospira sp.]|nr:histidinol-phosphatase HisJ family protein [Lachnospira sp.]
MSDRIEFDCHLHSCFSSDSQAQPSDVIRTAAGMLSGICVTEHNDFDYPPEDGKTVFNLDLDRYLRAYEALRPSLPNSFTLLLGVEQGLQKSVADRVNAYDPDHRLDFIIGSSHLVRGNDPYYPSFWQGRSVTDALAEYFDSILENLSCCRNFDVYGHLDYITRYIPDKAMDFHLPVTCTDQIDEILKRLIALGKGIEVNTAGFRSGLEPNPGKQVLTRYRQLGGEILTVGSDAHRPEDIAFHFRQCRDLLQSCGFRYVTVFKKRRPAFIRI